MLPVKIFVTLGYFTVKFLTELFENLGLLDRW
jgi:hypothetical protein